MEGFNDPMKDFFDKPADYGTAPLLGGEAVKQALDDSATPTGGFVYIGTITSSIDDSPHVGAENTQQLEESASVVDDAGANGGENPDFLLGTSTMFKRYNVIGTVDLNELLENIKEFDDESSQNGGSSGGRGDIFRRIAKEIGDLVASKNEAYGSSFDKTGDFLRLLYPEQIRPDQYDDALLMVRMFDKQMRIANEKDAFEENPYRDIAGYGICGASMSEGEGS